MPQLSDLHVHLLAGLDDGPKTWDDALAMCRILVEEGARHTVALAHQSERWPVTPEAIRTTAAALAARLDLAGIPLEVFPAAEVTATPDLPAAWDRGELVSIGDHGRHLLVEMPHGLFVDLRPVVRGLAARRVTVILAHPERHPEFLHEPGALDELIALGCLVQVSSGSVTDFKTPEDGKAIRDWFRRGCVHLLGSDGHSPRKRKPLLKEAAAKIGVWAGPEVAARVCGANGRTVLRGEPLTVSAPTPARRWWPARIFG